MESRDIFLTLNVHVGGLFSTQALVFVKLQVYTLCVRTFLFFVVQGYFWTIKDIL